MSLLEMPILQVRERNQVTLPREVVEFLRVKSPGPVEYQMVAEGVLIRPVESTRREDKLSKVRRLSRPGRGVYRNAEEVDTFIRDLRSE